MVITKFFCSVETLHSKNRRYVDRRRFHFIPAPHPIRYLLAGFNRDIQGHFRDLEVIPYPNPGSPMRLGRDPGT
jgi:hypothetical protein